MGTTRTMVHLGEKGRTWKSGDADMVLGEGRNAVASQVTSFVGMAFKPRGKPADPSYCVQVTNGNIPKLKAQAPSLTWQMGKYPFQIKGDEDSPANCASRGYTKWMANPEMGGRLITYGAWFHKP